MEIFVIIETCCEHFAGVAKTEEEAKELIEEYGAGFIYRRWELN